MECGKAYMRDIAIHPLIKGHNTADRAHGEVWSCQQAPDPEFAGIGMALLEVIHRHHDRKPHFGRRLGAAFMVHEPGKMLGLEARDPPVHGRARDPEKATETDFVPALVGPNPTRILLAKSYRPLYTRLCCKHGKS